MFRHIAALGLLALILTGCHSTRGLTIYRDGNMVVNAYETAQLPWVPGEFGGAFSDGQSSASLTIRHETVSSLGLAGISAAAGYLAAGATVP